MSWLRVHDAADSDRRVEHLSDPAHRLWFDSCLYSARNLSDGRIEEKWVRRRVPRKDKRVKLVDELIMAELWRPSEGGFEVTSIVDETDILLRHKSRAEVEEERRRNAASHRAG